MKQLFAMPATRAGQGKAVRLIKPLPFSVHERTPSQGATGHPHHLPTGSPLAPILIVSTLSGS